MGNMKDALRIRMVSYTTLRCPQSPGDVSRPILDVCMMTSAISQLLTVDEACDMTRQFIFCDPQPPLLDKSQPVIKVGWC